MEYTCPYCNRITTITWSNKSTKNFTFDNLKGTFGSGDQELETTFGLSAQLITCPNVSCSRINLTVALASTKDVYPHGKEIDSALKIWELLPKSKSLPLPDYIPSPLIQDYEEACLILSDSPKASATMSRRCLQGIIRDFWSVSGKTLYNEIDQIKPKIDEDLWDAIEAVRKIGNIGAHMETDINYIIDVDEGEAELLIKLNELLFKERYIARKTKEKHLHKLTNIAQQKMNQKREIKK